MNNIDPIDVMVSDETKLTTQLILVVDKSGSMHSVRESTIKGYNEYVGKLRNDSNSNYFVTLVTFNDTPELHYSGKPIAELSELTSADYQPDGWTALYDAIAVGIREAKLVANQNDTFLCVIITDGQDNASTEYHQQTIREIIEENQKTDKWTFVYLGADPTQDAATAAVKLGLMAADAMNYSPQNTSAIYSKMSNATFTRSMSMNTASGSSKDAKPTFNFCASMKDSTPTKDTNNE